MTKKQTKSAPNAKQTDLEEAIEVRTRAKDELDAAAHEDSTKFVDAYSRAANVVHQLKKGRKWAIEEFTDDELAERLRSLPERRRDAVIAAAQATSMAGKPIF